MNCHWTFVLFLFPSEKKILLNSLDFCSYSGFYFYCNERNVYSSLCSFGCYVYYPNHDPCLYLFYLYPCLFYPGEKYSVIYCEIYCGCNFFLFFRDRDISHANHLVFYVVVKDFYCDLDSNCDFYAYHLDHRDLDSSHARDHAHDPCHQEMGRVQVQALVHADPVRIYHQDVGPVEDPSCSSAPQDRPGNHHHAGIQAYLEMDKCNTLVCIHILNIYRSGVLLVDTHLLDRSDHRFWPGY